MTTTTTTTGEAATVALSRRYEQQLLQKATRRRGGAGAGAGGGVVPAVVVTGYLGSGKTTLLRHLLDACAGELRLGVLVNEVAAADIDSHLLGAGRANAAAGIASAAVGGGAGAIDGGENPAGGGPPPPQQQQQQQQAAGTAPLAGGCFCCSADVAGGLAAALARVANSDSYASLDALLVETSGVADAAPLADLLAAAGFRLDCVAAVVDAEAGAAALAAPDGVARAQLACADVVVLNKCDVAPLAAVAALEDAARAAAAPGAVVLRTRFGAVPPEVLLDVLLDDDDDDGGDTAAGNAAAAGTAGTSVSDQQPQQQAAGEIAFLSHEPVVRAAAAVQRGQPARQRRRQRHQQQQQLATAGAQDHDHDHQHQHHHQHHHHDHGALFASAVFASPAPLCMACFQCCVARDLRSSPGLVRAKGFVFFDDCGTSGGGDGGGGAQLLRRARYIFHLSGAARAECGSDGPWEGPPRVQLVLIVAAAGAGAASATAALDELRGKLAACVVGACGCSAAPGALSSEAAAEPATAVFAAQRFAELVQAHHRFELVGGGGSCDDAAGTKASAAAAAPAAAAGLGSSTVVGFSALGSPLHGVVAAEVNATLLRRANAAPGLFLCHVRAPPALTAASGSLAAAGLAVQKVAALQAAFAPGAPASDGEAAWAAFEAAVAPALRVAYAHVHACKCDVAAAAQALQA